MNNLEIFKSIFEEQREREEELMFRNPSFPFWYNWLIAGLIVALFVSFIIWGIDIHTNNVAERARAEVIAAMDEEHAQMIAAAQAQEAELLASQERVQIQEAKVIARAFFGIRNFCEKYGYTNSDLETYARCIFNRCDARGKGVEEIVSEKGQFLAYSDQNTLVQEYYDLALKFVQDWHSETAKPCDLKYQNAVLKDTGIYLVDNINAEVPGRWHA